MFENMDLTETKRPEAPTVTVAAMGEAPISVDIREDGGVLVLLRTWKDADGYRQDKTPVTNEDVRSFEYVTVSETDADGAVARTYAVTVNAAHPFVERKRAVYVEVR